MKKAKIRVKRAVTTCYRYTLKFIYFFLPFFFFLLFLPCGTSATHTLVTTHPLCLQLTHTQTHIVSQAAKEGLSFTPSYPDQFKADKSPYFVFQSCIAFNCKVPTTVSFFTAPRMDEIGGGGVASVGRATSTTERRPASPSDAVIKLPTPDRAGTTDISNSRPPSFSTEYDPTKHKIHSQSPDNSQSRSSQSLHPSESQSSTSSIAQHQHFIPPPSSQPLLPPISPSSAYQPPPPQWAQTKSPTSAPSNPFYSHAYRSATPPLTSSAEQSPLVSPAKRFSSGEVKPLPFSPTSPRQPLSEEDRQRFNQVPAPLTFD